MSKGKRKSAPGATQLVRQRLREGSLDEEDRDWLLRDLARLDLIAAIEEELGVQLRVGQKNSVKAMVDYLLGADPHAPRPKQKSRKHAKPQATTGTTTTEAGSDCEEEEDASATITEEGVSASKLMSSGTADSALVQSLHPMQLRQHPWALHEAPWMAELQVELAAAAAEAESTDVSGTAESAFVQLPPGMQLTPSGQLVPAPSAQASVCAAVDDGLVNQLLQQLLQDMQLNTQPQPPQLQPPHLLPPAQLEQLQQQEQQQQQQQYAQQQQLMQQQYAQQQLMQQRPVAGLSSGGLAYSSAPLPLVASSSLAAGARCELNALSCDQLPSWSQAEQGGSNTSLSLRKRSKQQLFDRRGPVPAPFTVELSGPSADVPVKRILSNSGAVSTSTGAGQAAAAVAATVAAAAAAADYGCDAVMDDQQPSSSHKSAKGMKGLARKVKALLKGGKAARSGGMPHLPPASGSVDASFGTAPFGEPAARSMPRMQAAAAGSATGSCSFGTQRSGSAPGGLCASELQRLRELYADQDVAGGLAALAAAGTLAEQADVLGALPAPPSLPGIAENACSPPQRSSAPFMKKLSRALRIGGGRASADGDEGTLVTERSNSSFSLFLEKVANRWGPHSNNSPPASAAGASTAPSQPPSSPRHAVEATGGSFSLCGLCSRENSRTTMRLASPAPADVPCEQMGDAAVEPSGGSLTAMLSSMAGIMPCLPGRRMSASVLDAQPEYDEFDAAELDGVDAAGAEAGTLMLAPGQAGDDSPRMLQGGGWAAA